MVVFFLFIMAPIVITVTISFDTKEYPAFPIDGFSLRWYRRVWEYRPFVDSLIVSVQLALASAFLACLIAVPGALALVRSRPRPAEALSPFLLAPTSIPLIVLALAPLSSLTPMGFGLSFPRSETR